MRRFSAGGLAAAVLIAALPASAAAGTLTLHPSGFGEHSYAAWKAHQGRPDSKGNDDQALYFQKMTTTPTVAAGVAVIKGIAGLPADDLTGLAWDHREDGHCGAGAARWNVNLRLSNGSPQTIFLGCNAAQHAEKGPSGGHGWCHDTQTLPVFPSGATITGLAIVFDEGNDTANPPPAGCAQEQLAGGFVHLDNIEVETSGVTKCWTGANDNSNQSTGACTDPPAGATALPGTSLSVPTGIALNPTDTELVTGLRLAYPEAPLTSWFLYPDVIY
jgi:hypothetical protein